MQHAERNKQPAAETLDTTAPRKPNMFEETFCSHTRHGSQQSRPESEMLTIGVACLEHTQGYYLVRLRMQKQRRAPPRYSESLKQITGIGQFPSGMMTRKAPVKRPYSTDLLPPLALLAQSDRQVGLPGSVE